MKINARFLSAAFISAALLTAPLAYASSDEVDAALKERLVAQLKLEGYDVRKVQMEDGMIEAYAVKDGKTAELYFDKDLKPVQKAD